MDTRIKPFILAAALMVGLHLPAQTPPPNDDYENRIQLTGTSNIFSGTTVGATAQEGELYQPYSYTGPYCSVWWTWTAPLSGPVSIDLVDYSDPRFRTYEAYLALWTDVVWTNRTGQNDYGMYLDIPGHARLNFFANAGTTYDIQVSSRPYGTFTFRLLQTNAPLVLVPPHDRLVSPGDSTFFGVVASGLSPNSYQWRLNGVDLTNETAPILSLDNIDSTMAGTYTVIISNDFCAIESAGGTLTIRTNDVTLMLTRPQVNPDGSLSFEVAGQALTSYRMESSTNLVDWKAEQSLPLPPPYRVVNDALHWEDPNSSSIFFDQCPTNSITIPLIAPQKFIRATRYVPTFGTNGSTSSDSQICVNNLRKIRFAKELWGSAAGAYWFFRGSGDVPTFSQLSPYMRSLPTCPLDYTHNCDTSYVVYNLYSYPTCNLNLYNHVLEEPPDNH